MAKKEVFIGSMGPFLYDDSGYEGVETTGSVAASDGFSTSAGTNSRRLLESDANKDFKETDLADYVQATAPLDASDDGNGGIDISRNPQSSEGELTDNTGGTTDDTMDAVSGTGDDATLNNNLAEVTQKLNSLIQTLKNENILN